MTLNGLSIPIIVMAGLVPAIHACLAVPLSRET